MSQEERNQVATAIFHAGTARCTSYGVIHGDPHLGNYQVRGRQRAQPAGLRQHPGVPAKFVAGVIDLYEAIRTEDMDRAHHAYEQWGFTRAVAREDGGDLNQWARFIYEPLLDDRVRPIQQHDDPDYGRKVAEKVYEELKRSGGVRPPREFVLMDRSAVGLGSVFLRLKAELNWSELFREMTAGFDAGALATRQAGRVEGGRRPRPR